MVEPFLISKALDITPTALGKSTFATLKGLAVLGIFCFMIYAAYITLVKPHFNPLPTTTENIQIERGSSVSFTEYHYSVPEEDFFVGIKLPSWLFNLKIGISKDKRVEKTAKNSNIKK